MKRSVSSSRAVSAKLAPTLALLAMIPFAPSARAQGVSIDSISPKSARHGETVTINGRGFGALNVQVTVGGVPAPLLGANGNSVTFRVPGGVKPGPTQVTARNPGSQIGSIEFRVLEGILLPGNSSVLVKDATFDLPPVGVGPEEIQNGILLTRLDLRMVPNAAAGLLNAALTLVDGGIVSMAKGFAYVTIAIPKPASLSDLLGIVQTLNSAPGVAGAFLATEAVPQQLPTTVDSFLDKQLLPTRFSAAWNASSLATKGCETRRVRVLVADDFLRPAPSSLRDIFDTEVPNFAISGTGNGDAEGNHGYNVTTTLGALYNSFSPTGANPFNQCLNIIGVQMAGTTSREKVDRILQNFPVNSDSFILNYSMAFNGECIKLGTGDSARCKPGSVDGSTDLIPTAYSRADVAEYWKARTFDKWFRFLVTPAAGNWKDKFAGTIYPGLRFAQYQSAFTIATGSDPFFPFMSNEFLWTSATGVPDPSLVASPPQVNMLKQQVLSDGMDIVPGEDNVLITGSTTFGATFNDLAESSFSNIGPDVRAVGERIFAIDGFYEGTSFSAPQVAGLASYLWLLSDDLRKQPASVTRTAILENARSTPKVDNVIDAYAAALSLDAAHLPTPENAPVRLSILDLNNDGVFDQADIAGFVGILFDNNGNPRLPTTPDYSRFDLNGDGFKGGPKTERFDLDRFGSTQYGHTFYSPSVTQMIEGSSQTFDETAVTDADVLCYYAYSGMYKGDPNARKILLGGHCGTVKNFPAEVGFDIGIQGFDDRTGVEVFQQAFLTASNTSSLGPPPLPLVFNIPGGTFQSFPFEPVTYALSAQGDGPVSLRNLVPATGSFIGSVACSESGNSATNSEGTKIPPAGPNLQSSFGGSLSTTAPPQGLTFTLGGQMTRGNVVGASSRDQTMTGHVFLRWQSAGGTQQSVTFEINDGTSGSPSPSPGTVPLSKTILISPPGFIDLSWNLQAGCDSKSPTNANGDVQVERSGEITVSYSFSN